MTAVRPTSRADDRRLWLISAGASLAVNSLLVIALAGSFFATDPPDQTEPALPEAAVVVEISPELVQAVPERQQEQEPRFAHTSPEQAAERPPRPRYLGDRDTRAASDAPPDDAALEVPSMEGVEPHRGEIETTRSDYSDGELRPEAAASASPPAPPPAAAAAQPAPARRTSDSAAAPDERPGAPQPASTDLIQGPEVVEMPAQADPPEENPDLAEISEQPPGGATEPEELPDAAAAATAERAMLQPQADPEPPRDPAFRGFRERTKARGSISRQGPAALDVADSALGRYHAQLNRAVELEWRRQCMRHRDLITPGFITVRFQIDPQGRVRNFAFVEAVEVLELQKGFTFDAIRAAAIPPMPEEVRRELDGQPLELIYNFYF